MVIVFSLNNAVFPARDDRLCVLRRNAYDKGVGVVSLVSHYSQRIKSIDLADEFIEMTIPDKPNSPLQRYKITEKGRQWLLLRLGR